MPPASPVGATPPQASWRVANSLFRSSGHSPTDLAGCVDLDQTNLSRCEDAQLVKCDMDRRARTLILINRQALHTATMHHAVSGPEGMAELPTA
jgi:hypothetical protein